MLAAPREAGLHHPTDGRNRDAPRRATNYCPSRFRRCRMDHGHHLIHLTHHLGVDLMDPVGKLDRREIGRVNLVDVGFVEGADPGERFVDGLIQGRIITGDVEIPQLIIAWRCSLSQSANLIESPLGKRQCALGLFRRTVQCLRSARRSIWAACIRTSYRSSAF